MDKPNYNGIVLAKVRYDNNLKSGAKIIYSEIAALVNIKGYFWFNNNYFGKLYNKNKSTINRYINSLVEEGYIKICEVTDKEIVNKLKNKNLEGKGFGKLTCEWCGINTSILDKHHYPVPQSRGGKDTVGICPNCHNEFHFIEKKVKIKDIDKINHIKEIMGVID